MSSTELRQWTEDSCMDEASVRRVYADRSIYRVGRKDIIPGQNVAGVGPGALIHVVHGTCTIILNGEVETRAGQVVSMGGGAYELVASGAEPAVLIFVWSLREILSGQAPAQSSVAPDGSSSLAPPGATSSAPRVNADIGPAPESDDGDDKNGQ